MEKLPFEPNFNDVVKAYKFLKPRVRHTPTEYSYALSEIAGAPVYLKLENQQMCGSFKVRGALNKMFSLTEEERAKGVITCSSGNHGQGVAMAAKELHISTKIFVPDDCPDTKMTAMQRIGQEFVEILKVNGDYNTAEKDSRKYAADNKITYVSSFEDPIVIAGQGTAGVEMMTDEPDIEVVLVPAGGGGLLNGIGIAAKAINPNVEVLGVESVASNPFAISWESGIVKEPDFKESLAEGLFGSIPQSLLTIAKKNADGIIEVTEDEIAHGIAYMFREQRQVIEGAGIVGISAVLAGKAPIKGRKTGIIVSGGNIDGTKLMKILAEN